MKCTSEPIEKRTNKRFGAHATNLILKNDWIKMTINSEKRFHSLKPFIYKKHKERLKIYFSMKSIWPVGYNHNRSTRRVSQSCYLFTLLMNEAELKLA